MSKLHLTIASAILTVVGVAAMGCTPQPAGQIADAVYINGKIYTVNEAQPWAEAVAIKDGKFLVVGSSTEVEAVTGGSTEVIDLDGSFVLPGMIDIHSHPSVGGLDSGFCHLPGTFFSPSFEQTLDAIRECKAIQERKGMTFFRSFGHSAAAIPPEKYNRHTLDEMFGEMPAYLEDETGHNAWVNTAALKRAGIDRNTPDPGGGNVIERDANGDPDGRLTEFGALNLVKNILPPTTVEDQKSGILYAMSLMNQGGITATMDAQIFERHLPAWEAAVAEGSLTAHATLCVQSVGFDGPDAIVSAKSIIEMFDRHELKGLGLCAKVFGDGSIEGLTAALVEPYVGVGERDEDIGLGAMIPDEAPAKSVPLNFQGDITLPLDIFNDTIRELDAAGLQIKIHANGDGTVRHALDALQAVIETRGSNELRHHIDHLNVIHPDDIPRFAELGIPAGPYPMLAAPWDYQTELLRPMLGHERWVTESLPLGSLVRSGAIVAAKTDWNSIPYWPFHAIEVAITRKAPGRPDGEALNADEGMTLEEAIRGWTINGAYVMRMDSEIGSIEEGKWADMIVLDQNLLEVPATDIHKTEVQKTIFKGEVVYQRGAE